MIRCCLVAGVVLAGAAWAQGAEAPPETAGMPLVYESDFEKAIDGWGMTDPKAWERLQDGDRWVLALTGASDYEPAVRSPKNIARIEGLDVTDFVLVAKVKQTGREYGHRDFCIFFGYRDPSHFYYVHLASQADDHANSIFLVNGAPRVSIAQERTDGTKWDDAYHEIKVVRNASSGDVVVYFDGQYVMKAVDKTFTSGGVGVGSFDDTGNVAEVRVWGKKTGK